MTSSKWWARGLLFENCSCQLVCPGHIHFDQLCTHERCQGYWAFRFEQGEIDGLSLAGRRAIIVFDSPQRMIDGGWTQVLVLDSETPREHQAALESLFNGERGGPWEILGRFVATRLKTRLLPIDMEDETQRKRVTIPGILESTVEALRGRNRDEPVRFENIFNQIHSPSQVIARGQARYDDGTIRFDNAQTHGLWSDFSWRVD
ncbi:MAG TPA: DUF1326 domain-containing protein [Vicinamibacteria bacterium]|nr:DUF1326 domain-containing protein [Vicinamibacteria bacterium]